MGTYARLCKAMDREQAPIEEIERPVYDWMQDGWLRFFEKTDGWENATTSDELYARHEEHAGLVVTCYKQGISAEIQSRTTTKVLKNALIKKVFSLDGVDDDGTAYAELVEDMYAEIPFRKLEDFDALMTRIEQDHLTDEQRAAIKRFALAWAMQEAGYALPRNVVLRVSRDRKATGLPLILKKGR